MAKRGNKSSGAYPEAPKTDAAERRKWEVDDALHTLRRAGEIVHDKKLMTEVKALAGEKIEELEHIQHAAGQLAKMGKISPKQMAKLAH
jgi:hypothetical protein